MGQFSEEKICRAAIAAIMGRDPQIINVDRVDSKIVYTSYIRPDDRSRWANRCRVDKQKALFGHLIRDGGVQTQQMEGCPTT